MSHSAYDNDDAIWDRLVDGELSAEERRELIASCDGRPDLWRRCATAFLEAQTWRGAMQRLVVRGEAGATPASAREAFFAAAGLHGAHSRSRTAFQGVWLAVAAGLMVAFLLGRQLSDSVEPAGNMDVVAVAPQPAPVVPPAAPPVPQGDAITLVVNNSQGVPQRVQVPLVEGRHLGQEFADAPQWSSPQLKLHLQGRGLDLAARRRYAPIYFEQQDRIVPMVVPVDDAIITPVSRPVY